MSNEEKSEQGLSPKKKPTNSRNHLPQLRLPPSKAVLKHRQLLRELENNESDSSSSDEENAAGASPRVRVAHIQERKSNKPAAPQNGVKPLPGVGAHLLSRSLSITTQVVSETRSIQLISEPEPESNSPPATPPRGQVLPVTPPPPQQLNENNANSQIDGYDSEDDVEMAHPGYEEDGDASMTP